MKKMALLLILVLAALPLTAGAHSEKHHEDHNVCVSNNSSFDFVDGDLVFTHKSRRAKDRVVVTEDGDLTINGDEIRTDDRERKMQRELYRESAELEDMALAIAADAGKIAAASTEFATAQLASALRSLRDDDSDVDRDELEAVEGRFEEEIADIEELADKIEDQADEVVEIADDLKESIPELADLDWFLDD